MELYIIQYFNLIRMLQTLELNIDTWPIDKSNRWLGFIQGILCFKQLIDVDEERDFSRPLFHDYYKNNNIEIPITINLKET